MGRQPLVPAPRTATLLLALLGLAVACGGSPSHVAGHSPTASATPSVSAQPSASPSGSAPSPQPVTGAYGVLVGSQASSTYDVSIVGVDGKVVATAQASTPVAVSCANAAAAVVPASPVSTSNSRVYFMDAQGVVRFLAPNGASAQATTVPAGTASRRSIFAISPDDQRIAVIVADFNSSGAATRLYIENLSGGGNHLDLFTETGAFSLWPIGWHGTNNLVLGKTPSCTQGGGPFCCGARELHVVDPATATRRFTIGDYTNCPIVGAPSPGGAVCENGSNFTTATVDSWTGGTIRTFSVPGATLGYLSPVGDIVALVDNNSTSFYPPKAAMPGMFACTWIDEDHVLSGGDAQHQPRVGTVTSGTMVPVSAQGDCGGRIPGGL